MVFRSLTTFLGILPFFEKKNEVQRRGNTGFSGHWRFFRSPASERRPALNFGLKMKKARRSGLAVWG
jgi:hypothetical protein